MLATVIWICTLSHVNKCIDAYTDTFLYFQTPISFMKLFNLRYFEHEIRRFSKPALWNDRRNYEKIIFGDV